MKITVIGCGYLGAVHAASMAELGHEVTGIDLDPVRIDSLQGGVAPFHEPGLDALLQKNASRLNFTTDMAEVADAKVHFVAVGTPESADGSVDMTYVNSAIESLVPYLSPGNLVVGKSTVPVGTAEKLSGLVNTRGAILMWNPEFLREGTAVRDTLSPDRLVYGLPEGEQGERARDILDEVFASIIANGKPRLLMNLASAELVKVAANSFLATKISFINAMAEIADATGADVTALADAIGYDNRIGHGFLRAGIGFGGGCLPKDIRGFLARAKELGIGQVLDFLADVDAINLRQRDRVTEIISEELGTLESKVIAIWGIAFKPDSDDVRDSPALHIAKSLADAGATVISADPQARDQATRHLRRSSFAGSISLSENHRLAATGADAIVLATEWSQFMEENPSEIALLMRGRLIVDGRNCLDAQAWKDAGFTYRGIGRN